MKKILFIDRDGTIINEAPPTYQIDSFDKLSFYPGVFQWLGKIARELDYELVMVTNQDGLGTEAYPTEKFEAVHKVVMDAMKGEGIEFKAEYIDASFPHEHKSTRKPGIGMLLHYLNNEEYDLAGSFVIGDRPTDVELARNLGCKAIFLSNDPELGLAEVKDPASLKKVIALETSDWEDIYALLKLGKRTISHRRKTNETDILVEVDLEGNGLSEIETGLGFFDHMLDQVARHGKMDLKIRAKGDLHIDEHHTIEDTGIALGEAFSKLLSDKRGMERYGFALPMDEAEAKVLIDFGGRNWIVWNAEFRREKIGEMPTEMFFHFFKSFSDAAKCNLNIECKGENEHHKIEAIFKAFAKAIRMAVKRDPISNYLPSTKGSL
ncbi:MAG TPA: bifunctional histidinol-phosphatase/imidazoleglycerol-phosphate dehydratase HisB [Chitinophagaceae bacterium]|nr:bifunctional histidinol-phosphatase/imidazoleglycerol-phosphate dehydratase HisB [Chitinophagaceae bacterium]